MIAGDVSTYKAHLEDQRLAIRWQVKKWFQRARGCDALFPRRRCGRARGVGAGEDVCIGKSGSRFTGQKARARPCLHPLPAVDLAGWLVARGHIFWRRPAMGKVSWYLGTLSRYPAPWVHQRHWPKTGPWRAPTFCPALLPLLPWGLCSGTGRRNDLPHLVSKPWEF